MVEDANLKDLLSTWGLSPKPCDNCKTSPALLFCRPHSVFLCSACDADIHSKPLTSGHGRVWLCEVCEQSPADVTCKADSAALCSSCDHRIHSANPLAARHLRLPVAPFFDSPSVLNPQSGTDFRNSLLNFESTNSFVDLNQLMPSTDSEVPIKTKSNCVEIDFSNPTAFQFDQGGSQSVSSSETGVVPDGIANSMSEVSNSINSYGGEMDRKAKVMRYLEKKKNRKFQKTIRYASRKAYAERRPRIKGRFAKRVDVADGNVEQIGFFTDHGVVPLS